MLINKNNYNAELIKNEDKNKRLSEELVKLFEGITHEDINIASVGNSIASGYSKCDEMIPLLARSDLASLDSKINLYSYARIRRNEELNVIKWYKSNISHAEINALLIDDILAKAGKYANFSEKQLDIYKKMASTTNIGLNDFVKLNNNIIIYNGLTGTFTDRIRKGNIEDRAKLLSSFSKDFECLKSLLLQIYLDNPHIQVYICGLPDFMGLGLSNYFDKYIKKALEIVPNVRYIKAPSRNVFAKFAGQKEFDIHYSKPEYLILLNDIFTSILTNYLPLNIINKILAKIASYSKDVEMNDTTSKGDGKTIELIIKNVLDEYADLTLKYHLDIPTILDTIWQYYNEFYLVNYGCTNRVATKNIIKSFKRQS